MRRFMVVALICWGLATGCTTYQAISPGPPVKSGSQYYVIQTTWYLFFTTNSIDLYKVNPEGRLTRVRAALD